jgi:hypothetical protein
VKEQVVFVNRTRIATLVLAAVACLWAGATPHSQPPAAVPQPPSVRGDAAWKELDRSERASLMAAFELARYEARAIDGASPTVAVSNPEHDIRATFGTDEVRLRAGSAALRLRPMGIGYGSQLQPMTHLATRSHGARVELDRDSHVTEWWNNRKSGLEQGFTVRQAPQGRRDGAWLRVALAVDGDLAPSVSADGQSATFVAADGSVRLQYDHLQVFDATGRTLPSRMSADAGVLSLETDDRAAVYPVTIDPIFTSPILGRGTYVKATNSGALDAFGWSVAIDGDTAVVGAYAEDGTGTGSNPPDDNNGFDRGAAYVFVRSSGVWSSQAYLKASNPGDYDYFGWTVAVSGDTIVVGAPLEDGSGTGQNPEPDDNALDSGAVYLFTRSGTVWSQQAYLKSFNAEAYDFFGWSVDISGNTLAVGALLEDGNGSGVNPDENNGNPDTGAAYVFERSGSDWNHQAYVKASNPDGSDQFGHVVALDVDTLVVTSIGEDSNGTGINPDGSNNDAPDAGAAYVFVRSSGEWSQQAFLKAFNTNTDDQFGYSVDVSGDTIVIGAGQEDGGGTNVNPADNNNMFDAGAAYVFVRNGGSWSQQAYLKSPSPFTEDWFGVSVSIDGDLIVVGTYLEDGSGSGVNPPEDELTGAAGAVYAFSRIGTTWTPELYLKSSNPGFVDYFGIAVAVSGDTVIVGAYGEDGSGTGVSPPFNNDGLDSGAVYISSPPSLPSAPTNVGGTPGDQQVSVTFTPPANDGGLAITSYTVTSSPGGVQATGATSPVLVTGLTNGTPYTFTVVATTELGNSPASAPSGSITPRTVPSAPTDAAATGGNAQATVTFTASTSNGGSPITGYTVISDPAGGVDSNAGSLSTSHVVTGLTNGVSYTFTVVATNAAGNSAPSAASNSVTPVGPPDAPTAVTATTGNTQATVTFAESANNGGSPITGYTVTSSPAGGVDTGAGTTSTTHVITGLTNGVKYTFTVVATTALGSSEPSAPSNEVTPRAPTHVDLNGDGLGDAFLYDAVTGAWSRQISQVGGGFVEQSAGSWDPGWTVVPAKFNPDALTDFFLFNNVSGQWFKLLNDGTGFTTQATDGWWPGWEWYLLDLDGDGISDFFLYDPETGVWFKSVSTPTGFTYSQGGWNPGWEIYPVRLNNDAFGDMFLIDRNTGRWFWVLGEPGSGFTYPVTETWFSGWQIYPGDYSGDGVTDFLLHDPPTGTYFVAMTGASSFTYVQGGWSLGWTPWVMDINADGKDDLFLHAEATGNWFQMVGDGTGLFTNVGGQTWSEGWDLHPTDANGDFRGDIVLYHPPSGTWYQARNLVNGSFSYNSGTWSPGATVIIRPPIR